MRLYPSEQDTDGEINLIAVITSHLSVSVHLLDTLPDIEPASPRRC